MEDSLKYCNDTLDCKYTLGVTSHSAYGFCSPSKILENFGSHLFFPQPKLEKLVALLLHLKFQRNFCVPI